VLATICIRAWYCKSSFDAAILGRKAGDQTPSDASRQAAIAEAQPYWKLAEQRLRQELGDAGWKHMEETVSRMTEAAMAT
jgi:hypothetical protein